MPQDTPTTPAVEVVARSGAPFTVTRHGRVGSLAQAAALRGVDPGDIIKSMVVRLDETHYVFVLVPGDREISWPRLRAVLGVSRASMPDAATALAVTGYEPGTITPFGASTAWPVIADERVAGGTISIGAGAHGVALTMTGDDVVRLTRATLADVTEPVSG